MSGEADLAADLAEFAQQASALPWFARLGAPLGEAERDDGRAHMAGLGMPALPVTAVPDWPTARQAASAPIGEPDWWAAEERFRRQLLDAASARHGADALRAALSEIVALATPATMAAAATTAARMGGADQAMARAAAGAGAQALYLAALAQAAGHGQQHPFAAKLRLFAAGRWPLGVVGGRILVF